MDTCQTFMLSDSGISTHTYSLCNYKGTMEPYECVNCGEPIQLTAVGLVGVGGVCRYPEDPNQNDQGQHVVGVTLPGRGIPIAN